MPTVPLKHFMKSNYTANTPKINLDCIAVHLTVYKMLCCDMSTIH